MPAWAICGLGLLAAAPPAAADPDFPDLSSYSAVAADAYIAPMGYGNGGVRFSTPDGLHCALIRNVRGGWSSASCTGNLPGITGFNAVTASSSSQGTWSKQDLSKPETYQSLNTDGWHTTAVDPASYRPLPAGSKIEYEDGTCAVDATGQTACIVTGSQYVPPLPDHGFILKPDGSQHF